MVLLNPKFRDFKISQITIQPIPPDKEATETIFESIDNPSYFVRRIRKGTGCIRSCAMCGKETYDCIEWEKKYNYMGKLFYYTAYKIEFIPQDDYYGPHNREKRIYLIEFDENGNIRTLGDETKVQYFNEAGEVIRECDSYVEGAHGARSCREYKNGKWVEVLNFYFH